MSITYLKPALRFCHDLIEPTCELSFGEVEKSWIKKNMTCQVLRETKPGQISKRFGRCSRAPGVMGATDPGSEINREAEICSKSDLVEGEPAARPAQIYYFLLQINWQHNQLVILKTTMSSILLQWLKGFKLLDYTWNSL